MKLLLFILFCFAGIAAAAQAGTPNGLLAGVVTDEKGKPLQGVSVQLEAQPDSTYQKNEVTGPTGAFEFNGIANGYYRLKLSFVGMQLKTIDSLYFRDERNDFNLNEIVLKPSAGNDLSEVVIYAEKPLVQSKDGNITFNAAESALSAGSNASELLTNVPLITKDANGKLLVRGKEPKILIDDKPVELNQQQLQDLLESMPGSAIEKIEVMTNPPPQYANEQGGVINITTRKGRVGRTGRINVSAGTRGEASLNASYSYRKQGISYTLSGGVGYNEFIGSGYSFRTNTFTDSTNFFRTQNNSGNEAWRPNFRANVNYDINKFHSLNITLQYHSSVADNSNRTEYKNLNRFEQISALSRRQIASANLSNNANASVGYTIKTKNPGETIRFIGSYNWSEWRADRDFVEQFLNPDYSLTNKDSSQSQLNATVTGSYNARLHYDRLLKNKKTTLSLGGFYTYAASTVEVEAAYLDKTSSKWEPLEVLNNTIRFRQQVTNMRASAKQVIGKNFGVTGGLSAEATHIQFDRSFKTRDTLNSYWSFLPFANLNKGWENGYNVTLSYRRSIRRPGIGELNPTVEIPDRTTRRFGNPGLLPSVSDNFDFVAGHTHKGTFVNVGLGYNIVNDIFSLVRDSVDVTWLNIGKRQEYEASTWSGFAVSKKLRVNLSASYTYNAYDKKQATVRKFRDGGSFTSNLGSTFTFNDRYNATGSFTYNRFASPQGVTRSTVSMNTGVQGKFLDKRLTVTLNAIDPFRQQLNRNITTGEHKRYTFTIENANTTRTTNYRLSVAWNLVKAPKVKKKTPAPNNQSGEKGKKTGPKQAINN